MDENFGRNLPHCAVIREGGTFSRVSYADDVFKIIKLFFKRIFFLHSNTFYVIHIKIILRLIIIR